MFEPWYEFWEQWKNLTPRERWELFLSSAYITTREILIRLCLAAMLYIFFGIILTWALILYVLISPQSSWRLMLHAAQIFTRIVDDVDGINFSAMSYELRRRGRMCGAMRVAFIDYLPCNYNGYCYEQWQMALRAGLFDKDSAHGLFV